MQGSPRIDELRQKFHENPRRYFAPLANEYRKAGDPEQAIAICRAHLAQQPGHMSGHVVYGQALHDARRNEEARVVFEKALSLDPDNAIVLKRLGDIAREKGETAEAKHWYARALDADPQDSETAAYVAELTEPVTEAEAQPAAEAQSAAEAQPAPEARSAEEPQARPEAEPAPEPQTAATDTVSASESVTPAEPAAAEPPAGGEADVEVSRPEPAREPEVPAPEADEKAVPLATASDTEVPWRKTPPREDSPFVTRTMAEVYASQGYRSAALDVYRQLALQHPEDTDIRARIDELSGAPPAPEADETGRDAGSPEPAPAYEPEPEAEAPQLQDSPAVAEPFALTELSSEADFAPASEGLNLAEEPESATSDAPHFTEMEIASGDSWDTDSWGAGFSSNESVDLSFESPDQVLETDAPAPVQDVATNPDGEAPSDREPDQAAATPATEPTLEDPSPGEPVEEEPSEEEPSDEAPVAMATSVEAEEDEPQLVAYSPQLPEDEDLPHFQPSSPTMREFFATLGAMRPPTDGPRASFTARSAVPGVESPVEFASLFPDVPATEEDTRAAFALSGALGAAPSVEPVVQSRNTPSRSAPAASPATQESEEDIRRFREWLDGLAES